MRLRKTISELFSRNPRAFQILKMADLIFHHVFGILHEKEFKLLKMPVLRQSDITIIDIGANIGQSVLDLHRLFPNARLLSFEPNPALKPYLELCRKLVGEKLTYSLVGISDRHESITLYVPKRKSVFIYGEAALTKSAIEKKRSY